MLEIVVLAVAPGLFLLWFFYTRDRYEKEPRRLVAKTFAYGLLSPILAFPLELFGGTIIPQSDNLLILFLHVLLVVGLVEEGAKLLSVKVSVFNSSAFNEVMDGIVYTAAASLGFATLENVLYAVSRGLGVTLIRAVTSVPGHALLGGIMGYYVGMAKVTTTRGTNLTVKGLLIAIVLHGLYDFVIFAFAAPWNLYLVILLLISMGVFLRQLMTKAELSSPFSKWLIQKSFDITGPRLSCARCGKPVIFSNEHQKWYCSRCLNFKSSHADFVWYMPPQAVAQPSRSWSSPVKHCTKCGAGISIEDTYCFVCGSKQP